MHTKNAQRHKKTQARYENSTTKLVLKRCQTFAENITFIMFPQVKTQFSLSQKNSLVMETHLTDVLLWKTGIPESSYGCGCFKFIIVSHSSIRAAEDRIGPAGTWIVYRKISWAHSYITKDSSPSHSQVTKPRHLWSFFLTESPT